MWVSCYKTEVRALSQLVFSLFSIFRFVSLTKMQITIKQDSHTKANESGEETQKETMSLTDIGFPWSKSKVNSNSKARIESKIQ